jgi:ferredoxin-nitrite reductase
MDFSEEQKRYLEGLGRGVAAARAAQGATTAAPSGPDGIPFTAQNRFLTAGKTLVKEEEAKRARHGLDMWDVIAANAVNGEFPKGTDVFLYKFSGLFYVAPTQESFMLRLRVPNGILDARKFCVVADLADEHGGGYAHVTTRANLQIREIGPRSPIAILERLADAGLTSRGAGADNIRNITGNPTAGIDAQELYDTRPLGLALHHAILNHRELYGLPRKFNIAFDGGGAVSSLEDTNDIGFGAVRVAAGKSLPEGVYFRVGVGGITGHGDFAGDLGVAIRPEQCVPVALAIVRVFIDEGDRTDRKRARLKYVLDRLGRDAYLAAAEKLLPAPLPRLPLADCEPRPTPLRGAHAGFHRQRQPDRIYCGVALPLGRMSTDQMRGIAAIATRYGSGTIRLTVWQSLIISDIDVADQAAVRAALAEIGLPAEVSPLRAAFVACTGNTGCRFAASDTKRHALETMSYLEARVPLDVPINVHLTGCPNSCAQHYIGDIGLLGIKVAAGTDAEVEGYHIYVGGGYGERRELAREVMRDVRHHELPRALERLLAAYLAHRTSTAESFRDFAKRHSVEGLRALVLDRIPEAA